MSVTIDIVAVNNTKAGWDSAINDAAIGATKVEDKIEDASKSVSSSLSKAADVNPFGEVSKDADVVAEALAELGEEFIAVGGAAKSTTAINTAHAASNVAIGVTATGAKAAVASLTSFMLANPITATLIGIQIAAELVAAAYSLWPEATDGIEDMTKELKKQKDAVEDLLSSIRKRIDMQKFGDELEERKAQRLAKDKIKEIDSVEAAEKVKNSLVAQVEALQSKQRIEAVNAERLAAEAVRLKEIETTLKESPSWFDNSRGGDILAEVTENEKQIAISLEKQADLKRQIAALSSQAEAAQDKALSLPEELRKKELKRIEDVAKAEKANVDKKKKDEEDLAKFLRDTTDERIKAVEKEIDDEAKKKKEKKEKDKKEKESGGPEFVGLEQLGKNIQLAALTTTKEQRDRAAALALEREHSERLGKLIALSEKSIGHFETIASDSKKTAEKIDKVGTLA